MNRYTKVAELSIQAIRKLYNVKRRPVLFHHLLFHPTIRPLHPEPLYLQDVLRFDVPCVVSCCDGEFFVYLDTPEDALVAQRHEDYLLSISNSPKRMKRIERVVLALYFRAFEPVEMDEIYRYLGYPSDITVDDLYVLLRWHERRQISGNYRFRFLYGGWVVEVLSGEVLCCSPFTEENVLQDSSCAPMVAEDPKTVTGTD
jgi:hypothetical protein